jgi:hypothetical protein
MEGMQLASGSPPSGSSENAAPFAVQDHSQAVQELNDVLGRTISATCTDDIEKHSDSTSEKNLSARAETGNAHDAEAANDAQEAQCGYRPICLPGRSTPLVMFVCSSEDGSADASGAPALPNRTPSPEAPAQSAAN